MTDYQRPMYIQLRERILKKIAAGEYTKERTIPSEREMSKNYGLSRMTVKHAIQSLVEDEYLYRIHGKGTYVREHPDGSRIDVGQHATGGLSTGIRILGKKPASKVLSLERTSGEQEIQAIFAGRFKDFYVLERVRYADQEPICMQFAYFPYELYITAGEKNFEVTSLYEYMEEAYCAPIQFDETMAVIACAGDIDGYLGVQEGDLIYFCEYYGYTKDAELVEYTKSYFRADKIEFRFRTYSEE